MARRKVAAVVLTITLLVLATFGVASAQVDSVSTLAGGMMGLLNGSAAPQPGGTSTLAGGLLSLLNTSA